MNLPTVMFITAIVTGIASVALGVVWAVRRRSLRTALLPALFLLALCASAASIVVMTVSSTLV